MNKELIHGQLQNFLGRFEKALGHITHNDNLSQNGFEDQFEGVLEVKYGILKEQRKISRNSREILQPNCPPVYKQPFHQENGFTTAGNDDQTTEDTMITNDHIEMPKPGTAMSESEAAKSAQDNLAAGLPKKIAEDKDQTPIPPRVSNIPRGTDNPTNVSGSVRGCGQEKK